MFTGAELMLVKVQKVSESGPAFHFGLNKVVSTTLRLNVYVLGLELKIVAEAWPGGLLGLG
jgi:hypothetical protein